MAKHLQTGRKGEALAAAFLRRQGYTILHRNWRAGRAEIDIIARIGDITVIVEVKTLTTGHSRHPGEYISRHKIDRLLHAASIFSDATAYEGEFRFDLITVNLVNQTNHPGGRADIQHYPDAFFPDWTDP